VSNTLNVITNCAPFHKDLDVQPVQRYTIFYTIFICTFLYQYEAK